MVYVVFLGLFAYVLETRHSPAHDIVGLVVFSIVLGYLIDEIRQVSLLVHHKTHNIGVTGACRKLHYTRRNFFVLVVFL